MYITLEQYFSAGKGREGEKLDAPEATAEVQARAKGLLMMVNALLIEVAAAGHYAVVDSPNTGTQISGSPGGAGDGGFRLQSSATGAAKSKHKLGAAVDVYDPDNRLDDYITTFDANNGWVNPLLEKYGLFRETPKATPGWCHLQCLPPPGGKVRTYLI